MSIETFTAIRCVSLLVGTSYVKNRPRSTIIQNWFVNAIAPWHLVHMQVVVPVSESLFGPGSKLVPADVLLGGILIYRLPFPPTRFDAVPGVWTQALPFRWPTLTGTLLHRGIRTPNTHGFDCWGPEVIQSTRIWGHSLPAMDFGSFNPLTHTWGLQSRGLRIFCPKIDSLMRGGYSPGAPDGCCVLQSTLSHVGPAVPGLESGGCNLGC